MIELTQRKTKGVENSGEGNIKPLPKNGFGPPPPHLRYVFPPVCSRNVVCLRGNGHRPDQSHFLTPPKLVLEGTLHGMFSPKIARYVLPPPLSEPPVRSGEGDRPDLFRFPRFLPICSDLRSSGSFARGRCRRGRSEIPHFCSKLLLFALIL